ncbi:MAG: PEP-CTERM sorting domain-containing protein [Chthoniobacterales bacterium]
MKSKFTCVVALSLLQAAPLCASIIAYEPFAYNSGIANGATATGTNFSGTWNIGQGGLTTTPGLDLAGLPTTANSVKASGATRALESLAAPVTTGTTYLSFLLQGTGNSGGDTVGFILSGSTGSLFVGYGGGFTQTETLFGVGTIDSGNMWANATAFTSFGPISNTALNYLVLETTVGSPGVNLWINPAVAAVASASLGAANLVYSSVSLGNITGFGYNAIGGALPILDEVRFGTSFADVAGVPEPSTAALVGLGALGFGALALLRRRRAARS